MPTFLNPDENPILPGIDEEIKPQEIKVPEISVKFANPDDGLDEKCGVCGDSGCPQCGGRK